MLISKIEAQKLIEAYFHSDCRVDVVVREYLTKQLSEKYKAYEYVDEQGFIRLGDLTGSVSVPLSFGTMQSIWNQYASDRIKKDAYAFISKDKVATMIREIVGEDERTRDSLIDRLNTDSNPDLLFTLIRFERFIENLSGYNSGMQNRWKAERAAQEAMWIRTVGPIIKLTKKDIQDMIDTHLVHNTQSQRVLKELLKAVWLDDFSLVEFEQFLGISRLRYGMYGYFRPVPSQNLKDPHLDAINVMMREWKLLVQNKWREVAQQNQDVLPPAYPDDAEVKLHMEVSRAQVSPSVEAVSVVGRARPLHEILRELEAAVQDTSGLMFVYGTVARITQRVLNAGHAVENKEGAEAVEVVSYSASSSSSVNMVEQPVGPDGVSVWEEVPSPVVILSPQSGMGGGPLRLQQRETLLPIPKSSGR